VNLVGVKGFTALSIAVLKARQPVVGLLLASGADPNLTDVHGWTPLQRAVDTQRPDLVRQLLAHAQTHVDHRKNCCSTEPIHGFAMNRATPQLSLPSVPDTSRSPRRCALRWGATRSIDSPVDAGYRLGFDGYS
jgi:ankyrin repeat protein